MPLLSLAEKVCRKLRSAISVVIQQPRIFTYKLLSNAKIAGKPITFQPVQAVGSGVIRFTGQVKIGVFPSPFFFSSYAYLEARSRSAQISIGDGTWINNGFSAIAEHTSITIGKRVLIGTNVEIFDSDFHGTDVSNRNNSIAEWAKPVLIEDDVFLGSNVRVLKGVTIGHGSVIANSSVVVHDIPPDVVAGGIPAKVLKFINR